GGGVVERGGLEAELVPGEPVLREDRGDAFRLELLHVLVDALLRERVPDALELEHLHDVDRGEPAADDDRTVDDLELRARVAELGEVVEPGDERVLVDETLADVCIRAIERQRTITPGLMRKPIRHDPPYLC